MAVAEPVVLGSTVPLRRRALPRVRIGNLEKVGLAVLAITTIGALAVPLLAPHAPTLPVAAGSLKAPGGGYLLGTDDLGRDILSRVLYGIRSSWFSAIAVIGSGILIGGLIGLVAGFAGGWLDTVLMRITDLFLALPGPVQAIALVATQGPTLPHVLLAVGIVWWPWYARIVRGEVRATMARAHVDAARLAGIGRVRLALRHLLPAAIPAVLVTASLDVGNLILTLAGLAFIGLGAPPPAPELGAMVAQGLPYFFGQPWVALAPAVAIFILAFAANLAGDGVRDLLKHT
ncbi:MAG: ABC transporter permease [Actinomycetota bacterium]